MKSKPLMVLVIVAGGLALLVGGCLRIPKENLAKRYFVLEVARPENRPAAAGAPSLKFEPLQVAAQFEGLSFVYRSAEMSFDADFYNRFFIPPDRLVSAQALKWLKASGLFHYVIGPGDADLEALFKLQGRVTALYADFRDPRQPVAVLNMEFDLLRQTAAKAEMRFQNQYTAALPVAARTPEALVAGWNQGLYQILSALEADLQSHL